MGWDAFGVCFSVFLSFIALFLILKSNRNYILFFFAGAELAYQRVPGVVSTKVGYTQGTKQNPTYREVCSGTTGHAEAVAVDFDPSVVSFEALVDLFWERLGKSALTLNQVGNDVRHSTPYFIQDFK